MIHSNMSTHEIKEKIIINDPYDDDNNDHNDNNGVINNNNSNCNDDHNNNDDEKIHTYDNIIHYFKKNISNIIMENIYIYIKSISKFIYIKKHNQQSINNNDDDYDDEITRLYREIIIKGQARERNDPAILHYHIVKNDMTQLINELNKMEQCKMISSDYA